MVMFNVFIEFVFVEWKLILVYKMDSVVVIDLVVMQVVLMISMWLFMLDVVEQVIKVVFYNKDYFQWEFQKCIGCIFKKYYEFCWMECVMKFFEVGFMVVVVVNEVGYLDLYYFLRMFKWIIGVSFCDYICCVVLGVDIGLFCEIWQVKMDQVCQFFIVLVSCCLCLGQCYEYSLMQVQLNILLFV